MSEDQIIFYHEILITVVAFWVGIMGVFFTQKTIEWNKRGFQKISKYLPMYKKAVTEYEKPYMFWFTRLISGFFLLVGIFKLFQLVTGTEIRVDDFASEEIQVLLFYLVFFGAGCFGVYRSLSEERIALKIFGFLIGGYFIYIGLSNVVFVLTGQSLF